jgi:16S rRNA (uracil1498-N3)-methyltransferase
MHHFFVSPEVLARPLVTLTGDQARQVRQVLRMRLGEHATLLDNQGWAYEAILVEYGKADVTFQTVRRWAPVGEPRARITLFQAALKGERFAWALQKGTEIGVSRFVPVVCEHNVVHDLAAIAQKHDRWERIIQEAAEQSGRSRLPVLAPAQRFAEAVQPLPTPGEPPASATIRLILWEGKSADGVATLRTALDRRNLLPEMRIQLYVGPEGGFTGEEVRLAQCNGIKTVTLGPRTLRAETAGLVAATVILYETGEI